jgi:hypothetical protein
MRWFSRFRFAALLVLLTLSEGCIPMSGERVEPWETLARLGPAFYSGHMDDKTLAFLDVNP